MTSKPLPKVIMPSNESSELLTVRDVAALLRFKPSGVYALVAAKRIPYIKISNRVRFDRADVVAWLQRNRVASREEP